MDLIKCYNGHYYDADKYNACPHCKKDADVIEKIPDDGIVIQKCNWCGIKEPIPYTYGICPTCNNGLNGTPNETSNKALKHYHNGVKFYNDKDLENARTELLQFLTIEKDFEESRKYTTLASNVNPLEFRLIKCASERPVFNVSPNFDEAYYMLGAIEVEDKNILKAREYLNKAIKWNAFHFASIFENIETYKMVGDLEQFYQLTLQSHSQLYWPYSFGRYYRNLAYYFIEKQNWRLAQSLLVYSKHFEDTNMADNELEYIKSMSGFEVLPNIELAKKTIEYNNIPLSLNENIEKSLKDYYYASPETVVLGTGISDEPQADKEAVEYIFNYFDIKYKKIIKEKYCPNCGKRLDDEAEFCTKCGAKANIEPEQTVFLCNACHGDIIYGDRFCRNCGIDLSLIDVQSAIENEDDVQHALFTIEKLIEFHNHNDKDEWVLAKLLNLINYTPLYLAVDMDMQAMFSDINPEDLKPGDVITNKQDVHMKILTANVGDLEVIPMFTKGEYANASVIRQYPSDYLPTLIKMNKPVVINLFNDERFALPAQFLNHMMEAATGEKGVTDEIKCPVCGTDLPDGAKFCFKCGTQLNKDSETTVIKEGTVIQGKYKLIKKICDTGHNTTLYLALDERLNKTWAVKLFDKKKFNDDETLQTYLNMFVSQANFLKKLNHPSIARLVDIIEESDFACIVTEYVEGENLYKIIQQFGPQPEQTVLSWARQLCNTLIYLAGQKPPIIHRGISPKNIILQPNGTIKLMDFSIAREYVEGLEADEIALGIRGYAPPEQYGGAQTDCRTDIYGLGMTLHTVLTGADPRGKEYIYYPIRQYNSSFSIGLEYIVDKCTRCEADERYQTPLELLTDLYNIEKLPPKKGWFGKLKK